MNFFKNLRQKISIQWKTEYGWNEHNPDYEIEYTSASIPQEKFEKLFGKYLAQVYGSNFDWNKLGERIELPQDVIKHNAPVLLLGLPKVRVKHKLLTRKVLEIVYSKVGDAWVIWVRVGGVRRMF